MSGASNTSRKVAWPVVTLVSVGVVLVLGLGIVLLDSWARQQIVSTITDKTREAFSLPDSEPVEVDVAGFSALAQLVVGRLDRVSVRVDHVSIGDLSGGVRLAATGIPIDESKPVEAVTARFAVSEKSVQKLSSTLSAAVLNRVELVEPELRLGSEFTTPSFEVLGVTIPGLALTLGVGLEPTAERGELAFTPTSIEVNGARTSAEELRRRFGALATGILQTRTFCIAESLPTVLTLDAARVRGTELLVTLGAKNAVFSHAALTTRGSCG